MENQTLLRHISSLPLVEFTLYSSSFVEILSSPLVQFENGTVDQ